MKTVLWRRGRRVLPPTTETVFSTENNALASSEHMRPPTCDVPAHCSRLLLQTTRGRLQIKPFLYSRRWRRLDEKCAHNEGHDCSWKKNPHLERVPWHGVRHELEKGNKVAYCGTLTNKMKGSSAPDASSFILWQLQVKRSAGWSCCCSRLMQAKHEQEADEWRSRYMHGGYSLARRDVNKRSPKAQWDVPSMIDQGEAGIDLQINFPAFSVAEPTPGGSTGSSSLSVFRLIIYNLIHPRA